jgi:hypothetical protein
MDLVDRYGGTQHNMSKASFGEPAASNSLARLSIRRVLSMHGEYRVQWDRS